MHEKSPKSTNPAECSFLIGREAWSDFLEQLRLKEQIYVNALIVMCNLFASQNIESNHTVSFCKQEFIYNQWKESPVSALLEHWYVKL